MPGPPPCRYCNLIFHYCREGACPSAAHCLYCPLLPPGRPCRGGIHAARPALPASPTFPICCAVGAGHARPSTLPLLPFNLPYCREGICPSAAHCLYCPLLPPGRPCRGGIYAARPTFPSQPLVPITTHYPNIHLAQKSLSKFVEKIKNSP